MKILLFIFITCYSLVGFSQSLAGVEQRTNKNGIINFVAFNNGKKTVYMEVVIGGGGCDGKQKSVTKKLSLRPGGLTKIISKHSPCFGKSEKKQKTRTVNVTKKSHTKFY